MHILQQRIFWVSSVFSWPLCLLLLAVASSIFASTAHAGPDNGLSVAGLSEMVSEVSGVIEVKGIATHPSFRKWQLDLLLNGEDATFVDLGEEAQPELATLTTLNTALYPDGHHRLRLRVVHTNLNYDEYFIDLTFHNHGASSEPTALPPATSTPEPSPEPTQAPHANGLLIPEPRLRGTVDVSGVAVHPSFRKWQLDLLLNGDQTQATFIALGNEQAPTPTTLTSFDSTLYPNGQHVLRLRIVHTNMNYDEYVTSITIDNAVKDETHQQSAASDSAHHYFGPVAFTGENPRVYLTFDDGPHLPYTQQILNLLAEYDARATFFVLGSAAARHPEIIKALYDAGHGIGNHTWSHRSLPGVSEELFNQEILNTAAILGEYGATCMRPPYGATDASAYAYASKLGYPIVLWSIDTVDWKRPGADSIARSVTNNVFPGAIILMHDGGGARDQTVTALRTVLSQLSARGYVFATYCR